MKISVVFILLSILFGSVLDSCSGDDDGGYEKEKNQENTVMFKVYSNTPGVPITVSGMGDDKIIKDYWEGETVTKNAVVQICATCKDKTVLMTCEIYVNGKLKVRAEGNSYVLREYRIKGKGY